MSRFVRPETTRLEISQGDWLLVKQRLSAGEQRQVFARMMKPFRPAVLDSPKDQALGGRGPSDHPVLEIDPIQASLSTALAYLLDWSLVDDEGKPVVIRGQPLDVVTAALDALDLESFTEITQAIQAHEARMAAERAQAAASPFGDPVLSATS